MTVASLTATCRLLLKKPLTEGLVAAGKCHLSKVCLNVKVVLRHETEQGQSWGVTPLDGWPRDSVLELPGDALPYLGGQNVTMVNAVEIAVWLSATGSLAVSSLLRSFLLYASQSPSSVFAHHLLTTTADQPACPGDNFPMNSFHLGIGEAGEYPKGTFKDDFRNHPSAWLGGHRSPWQDEWYNSTFPSHCSWSCSALYHYSICLTFLLYINWKLDSNNCIHCIGANNVKPRISYIYE